MKCPDCEGDESDYCFLCNGTGVLCDVCSEPEAACECEPGGGPSQEETNEQKLTEEYWAKRAEDSRRVREDLRLNGK